MEFLNNTVPVDQLPRAEDAELRPIDRSYLKVLRWEWALSVLFLLVVILLLAIFIPSLRQPCWLGWLAGGWLLLTVTWFFLQEQLFRFRAYAVRERDIIYRSGWIIRQVHTCPFNRVLHCTVTAGPLERRFGIATLILYTAGPSATDLHVRGLQEAGAHALKEWITKKIADESVYEQ